MDGTMDFLFSPVSTANAMPGRQQKKGAEHVGHLPDEPVLLEKLANNDGIDLPVSLIEWQPIASELWTRINATESGRAECEDIPALEQDTTAIGADDVDNSVSTIAFTAYYSLNFQIETFAVIGSSCVERKEGRAFRCSAGAEAFSERMGWFGTDQELDIVKRFTKVVTGHAAFEESYRQLVQQAFGECCLSRRFPCRTDSVRSGLLTLIPFCPLSTISIAGALQTQRAQEGVGMPSNPKTWFNRPKLLSQYKMIVHVNGGFAPWRFPLPDRLTQYDENGGSRTLWRISNVSHSLLLTECNVAIPYTQREEAISWSDQSQASATYFTREGSFETCEPSHKGAQVLRNTRAIIVAAKTTT
ncbi:BZ3500_MvSof-1268-A1-R1_Chr1-1g00983 [Microbotryum saponariae]|uniref:BZ3500_MvSof-1268-A1-R1_Chr1-1g00983 protein n=1 Tax=Microbotryum saponariae TaxID=289078 RepID=A0A2X0KEG2_9BASI|nr:BZ3500_MvSof-1268-A1-R1_Chr1-1g00983 [Microbotryum saponariae]SCZ93099.1 BZ3501_MvSof-1269-A2-R1_Chr1-1g00580 [Microbotryum saponariae]